MKKIFFTLLIISYFLSACTNKNTVKEFSFYHWKNKALYINSYQKAIEETKAKKVFLHYFDVDKTERCTNKDGICPTYVLREVAQEYKGLEIVPVVYITNAILKQKNIDIADLSDRIGKLINQISLKHFEKEIKEIQIDCDWSETTKNTYFELLETLGGEFEIDVTIRLHQIKFQKKTGVPPVAKGTLMVYNVGDLKNKEENSILENKIVEQYINGETAYPLPLNIALPLFSQTVVTNNSDRIKLIRNTERELLENDVHFKKIDKVNFEVKKDTLYKGFYLNKGYQLKLEELELEEIAAAYRTIVNSRLKTNEIIFYHLDEQSLSNIDLKKLIQKL